MKKIILVSLVCSYFLLTTCNDNNVAKCAITNIDQTKWVDRFGDHVLLYIKSKWLSCKHQIPLLLHNFELADHLALFDAEIPLPINYQKSFSHVIGLAKESSINSNTNALYATDFCCELIEPSIEEFEQFRSRIRTLVAPAKQFKKLEIPPDVISIAVHVRRGSGNDRSLLSQQLFTHTQPSIFITDKPYNILDEPNCTNKAIHTQSWGCSDTVFPFRFMPDQYYIDQIILLSKLLNDAPLYVYIFSDHHNPREIVDRFAQIINKPNITFDCHMENKSSGAQVVHDLFAMTQFDCLIRARSHLSIIAEFIGDHKIVISPKNYQWIDKNKLVATEINLHVHDPALKEIIEKNVALYSQENTQ